MSSRIKTSANDWPTRQRRERERAEHVAAHGPGCEVCGSVPKSRGLNEDHDHKTGLHRGWLCWKCNKILLMQWVTPGWLRAAADYLEARS